jgi:RHS repeat-associated protein
MLASSVPALPSVADVEVGFVGLPGPEVWSHAIAPDSAPLDVTGDIDIRVLAGFADLTSDQVEVLAAKGDPDGHSNSSWEFSKRGAVDPTSAQFQWRPSSGAVITQLSTTGYIVTGPRWYRVTVDVNNGSSGHTVSFWYSDESPTTAAASVTWTLHNEVTTSGTTSVKASSADVLLGNTLTHSSPLEGTIYYAEIRNGIAGTVVANPDFRTTTQLTSTPPNYSAWTDSNSNPWTIIGPGWDYSAGSPGYLTLPGPQVWNYVVAPDAASLDITGDIDVRVLADFDDVTSNQWEILIAKGDIDTQSDSSWEFAKRGGPDPTSARFRWRTSTGAIKNQASTTGYIVTSLRWYRVTVDVSTAQGGTLVSFWYSDQPPETDPSSITWTLHGEALHAGTTSILASAADVRIGDSAGHDDSLEGSVYYAEIRNGIAGTLVANPDFRTTTQLTSTPPNYSGWTDSYSNPWTITGPGWTYLPPDSSTGVIEGTVWDDANLDMVIDVTELGLEGITVDLVDPVTAAVLASTATDVDGLYTFTLLADGDYEVDIDETTLPAGYQLTVGPDPQEATVAGGTTTSGVDFGYALGDLVTGVVWNDVNGDGLIDPGEALLEAVEVRLLPEVGSPVVVATDVDGHYSFPAVVGGEYRLGIDLDTAPIGYVPTTIDRTVAIEVIDVPIVTDFGLAHHGTFGPLIEWGEVVTVAGDGGSTLTDGLGLAASFQNPTDLVVVGRTAYVADGPAIRSIDLDTWEVSTVTGASTTGCVSGAPGTARFNHIRAITVLGDNLFVVSDCGVDRISLEDGTTTNIHSGWYIGWYLNDLTAGPDGLLYGGVWYDLFAIDPVTGVATDVADGTAQTVTSDDTYVYAASETSYTYNSTEGVEVASVPWVGGRTEIAAGWIYNVADNAIFRGEVGQPRSFVAGARVWGSTDGAAHEAMIGNVVAFGVSTDQILILDKDHGTIRVLTDTAAPDPLTQSAVVFDDLAMEAANVTTVAGDGTGALVDGTGLGASFLGPFDVVALDGLIYVADHTAIRVVDPATSEVTTLVGSTAGCQDSQDPEEVRLSKATSIVAANGYLFVTSDCHVARIDPATGATSFLGSGLDGFPRDLTVTGWGVLAVAYGPDVYLIDPYSGKATWFAAASQNITALTADDDYLYVGDFDDVTRFDETGASIDFFDAVLATDGGWASVQWSASMEVVGGQIFAAVEPWRLRTWDRTTGVYEASLAGNRAEGYADGTGFDAWLGVVGGIGSDGEDLWIADVTNHRLRLASAVSPLPAAVSPYAEVTVDIAHIRSATIAGTTMGHADGPGDEAQLEYPANGVVVDGTLYVGDGTYVRTVDLETGDVGTLVGNSATGCVDSPTGSAVRFTWISSLTTDGTYLYALDACANFVRRIAIDTGATSTLGDRGCCLYYAGEITYGPDDHIYMTRLGSILKINPDSGAVVDSADVCVGGVSCALFHLSTLTSDDTYVWFLTMGAYNVHVQGLYRLDPATMEFELWVAASNLAETAGFNIWNPSQERLGVQGLVSAGDYLYSLDENGFRRWSKTGQTMTRIGALIGNGYQDGIGYKVQFGDYVGLASDGEALYVTDAENFTIRKVVDSGFYSPFAFGFGWDGYGAWNGGINAGLGNFVMTEPDLAIGTVGPSLGFSRTYNSRDELIGPMGQGWAVDYNYLWEVDDDGNVTILYPDGRRELHILEEDTTYTPPPGRTSILTSDGDGGYLLTTKDRKVLELSDQHRLESITDRNGRSVTLSYDLDGFLETVTDDTSGRSLTFGWEGERIVSVATDPVAANGSAPYVWNYGYDESGRLVTACDPRDNDLETGICTTYVYDEFNRMTEVIRPEGNSETTLTYNADGTIASRTDGEDNTTIFDRAVDFEVTTIDPRSNATIQVYDERFRLVELIDPAGKSTTFSYDGNGNRDLITDPNLNTASMTFDGADNLLTETDGNGDVTRYVYDGDDNLTITRDPRSTSSSDNTYATTYNYDSEGNRLTETSPLGHTASWSYTDGTETAIGGGTMPAGLLETAVSPRGNVSGATPANFATTFEYDSEGDLRRVTTPAGLVTEYTHDELGRVLTDTVTDSLASTATTTTFTYDALGNVLTRTEPTVPNLVSSANHRLRTVNVYDDNSNLTSSTLQDIAGSDPDRVTAFTYDDAGRQLAVTDPEGGVLGRTYDAAGNVATVTDQEGRQVTTTYNTRNLTTQVTANSFVDDPIAGSTPRNVVIAQYSYDDATRRLTETDAEGNVTSYGYDDADQVTLIERLGVTGPGQAARDVTISAKVYDEAGNVLSEMVGDGTYNQRTVTYAYDNTGRLVGTNLDPAGLARVTALTLDANGNVTQQSVSEDVRTETTRMVYDFSDRMVSSEVENGTVDLETTIGYDERGNPTAVVDPRGNASGGTPADYTTSSTFDIAGRLVAVASPNVAVNGGSADSPTTTIGYNTFGDQTHQDDPRGNTTTTVFDRLSRPTEIHHPSYTPPGESPLSPVEFFAFDEVGNLTERISRNGEETDFVFDNFNRVVAQYDPLVTGEGSRGVTRFEYDDVGNMTATIDQVGARTESTYDRLNRPISQTSIVRQPAGGPLSLTSNFAYDDLGNLVFSENAEDEATSWVYNPASEPISQTDPLTETTSFEWQLGRQTIVTDPLGRETVSEIDLAGRLVGVRQFNNSATLLTTTGFSYDPAGNRTTVTTPRGYEVGADTEDFTTTYTFDALNRLTGVSQPTSDSHSIETSYGYDLAGNLTRFEDGEGHVTTYTYNTWNLPASTIEPSTTAHPDLDDRTWTTIYDAGGLPIVELLPGDVTIERTFDELGRLTEEEGTGDGTATATYAHNLASRMVSVSHPDGTITFEYDDRGLLLEAAGPAGAATYDYDAVGRMVERVDGAGTFTYSWTTRSELDTLVDPITGTTLDYTWDDASQLTSIAYGVAGGIRSYSYDQLGRLTSDVLEDDLSAVTAGTVYSYDLDGNLTSRDVDLTGNDFEGLHEYGYDNAGRLTTWEFDFNVVDYTWDDAGNRTDGDTDTYLYDQRNRLVSGPEGDYTYTPRGTLLEVDDGTPVVYDFDPLGRLTSVGTVDYTSDGLGRLASRAADEFTYQGFSLDPTTDGTFTYGRTPGGRLLSISDGTDDLLAGADRHGDLTHLYQPDGTVTDTALYDPFGDPADSTGSFNPQVGYQSDWTDPASGHVWMGARWYDGGTANFLSRDTVYGELATPISLNRYTYGWANPNMYWDPDGRSSQLTPMIEGTCTVSSCGSTNIGQAELTTTQLKQLDADIAAVEHLHNLLKAAETAPARQKTAETNAARMGLAGTGSWLDQYQAEFERSCRTGPPSMSCLVEFPDLMAPAALANHLAYQRWRQNTPGATWQEFANFGAAMLEHLIIDPAIGISNLGLASFGPYTPSIPEVDWQPFKGISFLDSARQMGQFMGALTEAATIVSGAATLAARAGRAGGSAANVGTDATHLAPNTAAGQRIFRAIEPDELADLAGSGAFRTVPGLEGKYFWPTRSQADDFAAMASKANMGGPYCVASGCIPANVLRQIEAVPMDGLGPAYFIPEEYLPLIDDILIHGG